MQCAEEWLAPAGLADGASILAIERSAWNGRGDSLPTCERLGGNCCSGTKRGRCTAAAARGLISIYDPARFAWLDGCRGFGGATYYFLPLAGLCLLKTFSMALGEGRRGIGEGPWL